MYFVCFAGGRRFTVLRLWGSAYVERGAGLAGPLPRGGKLALAPGVVYGGLAVGGGASLGDWLLAVCWLPSLAVMLAPAPVNPAKVQVRANL